MSEHDRENQVQGNEEETIRESFKCVGGKKKSPRMLRRALFVLNMTLISCVWGCLFGFAFAYVKEQKELEEQAFVDGLKIEHPIVRILLMKQELLKKNRPYKLNLYRRDEENCSKPSKPVIYFYPEQQVNVTVKLDFNGKLTYTYPEYADGWSVTASPDGALINHADGREYSYLFWEGESQTKYDFSKGFVVKGSDTVAFLQEKLAHLGLTPREYNEFIVYWLPQMQDNPYNLIAFQGAAYTDNAKLTITPEPDSVLRVFMVFRPLKYPVDISPQELKTFERKGFAVVEWGGTRVHWQ